MVAGSAAASQTAIIEAALALMDEGILVLTAQQSLIEPVSVSGHSSATSPIRMLFMAADEMLMESYEVLSQVDDRQALTRRAARAVDLYGNAFDKLRPIIFVPSGAVALQTARQPCLAPGALAQELSFGCPDGFTLERPARGSSRRCVFGDVAMSIKGSCPKRVQRPA